MLHFSRYGSTPVFLTGSAGAGKTATLNAAMRQLKGDVDMASIRAELMMNSVQVFTALATGLGIDIDPDSADDVELLGQNLLSFFESKLTNVVLPAPEGEDNITIVPSFSEGIKLF